jgi:multiple antibiotic resistance protein
MDHLLKATVTLLAVINPVVCGAIFHSLTESLPKAGGRQAAIKASLAIFAILVGSALVGLAVLNAFGISLDVFRSVGGLIIAHMGFSMLGGENGVGRQPPPQDGTDLSGRLSPLIMFAAGPGTIAAVVTIAADRSEAGFPWTALGAAGIASLVTLVILLAAARVGSRSPGSQGMATRFMGLIVVSMGLQFVLAGLKSYLG